MKSLAPEHALERAYVACGYLLGRRGDELGLGLAETVGGIPLAGELGHAAREQRARALADALTEVVRALHEQRLL